MKIITVVSSFAEDRIINTNSGHVEIREGGPALWITKALKNLNADYRLITGKKKSKVEIKITNGEEDGRIISISPIEVHNFNPADLYIVSTISEEFNLSYLENMNGTIALDVQGYIREHKINKSKLYLPKTIYEKISIFKTTDEELRFINHDIIEDQKRRIFIITKGARGFELYAKEKHYTFESKKIDIVDTIGAGDYLFATFCATYLGTVNLVGSAERAKLEVEKFLLNKE